MPTNPVAVVCEVPDGLGIIEATGNDGASLLLLKGRPVLLEGCDGYGSVGWLASRAIGRDAPGTADVKALTAWLAAPELAVDPLTGHVLPPDPERLRPLLSLLAPGRYAMTAPPAPHLLRLVHPRPGHIEHWYPDEELALLTTDRWPPPDAAAVRGYARRIRDGARPALVALRPDEESMAAYLLDGHHKLAAYHQAGIQPLLLMLTPITPAPFRLRDYDAAREAFPGEPLRQVFGYIREEADEAARAPRTG
ncbi:hypothetical protein [Streptomyces sp. ICC4]|uniref:hypothetical protein n=1 Tax=Streptomyces sp. ICC4 TaxID=2099584 RepID=UPI000DC7B41B|nr:hypothetical protein [Streptomyces sp. ICC4]AWZ05550.1 hypothetical protein DRB89_13735 [Streptomyces sp. ICC4]